MWSPAGVLCHFSQIRHLSFLDTYAFQKQVLNLLVHMKNPDSTYNYSTPTMDILYLKDNFYVIY